MLSYAKTISAKPLPDYKVAVVFNNGQRGVFDCKYLLDYEVSAPLADYSLSIKFALNMGRFAGRTI